MKENINMSLEEVLSKYIEGFKKIEEEEAFSIEKKQEEKSNLEELTITELDSLSLCDLNERTEVFFKNFHEFNFEDNFRETFEEAKERLLDVLNNRLSKTEIFTGISSISENIRFRNIIRDYEDGVIQMPRFQRKYIWDKKRASELISSLIYGIPIPPIYSYEIEGVEGIRNIIDGQQRLTSLLFFYYKAFPRSLSNRLSYNQNLFGLLKKRKELIDNLNKKMEEKKNNEDRNKQVQEKIKEIQKEIFILEKEVKNIYKIELDVDFSLRSSDGKIYDLSKVNEQVMSTILNRNVNIITIKSENKTAMAHIFNVYNTGGIRLTENEIRKAIFAENELYKNIMYISNPNLYQSYIEEDKLNIEDYKLKAKILGKIIGNKDTENALFKILSYNFNLQFDYLFEGKYQKDKNKINYIINKEDNSIINSSEELINILNTKINYAKSKIYSIIDEYANYVSENKNFSIEENLKLDNFIKIIENSPELNNKNQYNIKNITCIYVLLDYYGKLQEYNENIELKEKYFEYENKSNYKTLEKERFLHYAKLLKEEGVL